ncbi:MAG: hypothetical protein HON04_02030 [Planctomicrobium sp.]|nr:hypothetical protein [Planctomicrobium sp.]
MEASAADLQSEEILTRLEVAAARQASYAWGIGFFVFDAIAYACGIHLALTAESTGILLPCCISQMLMSNTEYLHHTHPAVRWFRDPTEESFDDHQARVSIHVQYPQPIDWFVHWIMDHTAHHMQPTIPLYRLNATQAKIDSRSENTVQYHFKFSKLLKITRQCKLFDDETGNWTDFKGQPTGVTSELGD